MEEFVCGLLEITFFNNRTEIVTIVGYTQYTNGDLMFLMGSNHKIYPWKNVLFFEKIRGLTDKEKRFYDITKLEKR